MNYQGIENCPVCDREPDIHHDIKANTFQLRCCIAGPIMKTKRGAINEWNTLIKKGK